MFPWNVPSLRGPLSRMSPRALALPLVCLAGTAILLAPATAPAFGTTGDRLGPSQRDVRVFDNFADASAHGNLTPAGQFPGWTDVELAIWKAVVEWGSTLHGDGSGDPVGGNTLGSGGANFDAFWAGAADGVGSTNDNVVSALASCGGGLVAFTELSSTDGWRMRFCDEWEWSDDPAGPAPGHFDIQAVATREYGFALGLGHSSVPGATMYPTFPADPTAPRSIEADDAAGVQFVYGQAAASKPRIVATVADGTTITIHGTNFEPSGLEVWFTRAGTTPAGSDPLVRVIGATSNGSTVQVLIPGGAGPGDVLVRNPGSSDADLSNAFPTDLVGTFGTVPGSEPVLLTVLPGTVPALLPGSAQVLELSGLNLAGVSTVSVDGVPLAPARVTLGDDTLVTVDPPQLGALGSHVIAVTDGFSTSSLSFEVVAPAGPVLQLGTGDPGNVVDRDDGLDVIVAGPVGALVHWRASRHLPSLHPPLHLDPSRAEAVLINGVTLTIPAQGWIAMHLASLPDPGPSGATWTAQAYRLDAGRPFAASALQSILLVR
jgi:hypothetical protein